MWALVTTVSHWVCFLVWINVVRGAELWITTPLSMNLSRGRAGRESGWKAGWVCPIRRDLRTHPSHSVFMIKEKRKKGGRQWSADFQETKKVPHTINQSVLAPFPRGPASHQPFLGLICSDIILAPFDRGHHRSLGCSFSIFPAPAGPVRWNRIFGSHQPGSGPVYLHFWNTLRREKDGVIFALGAGVGLRRWHARGCIERTPPVHRSRNCKLLCVSLHITHGYTAPSLSQLCVCIGDSFHFWHLSGENSSIFLSQ